MTPARVPLAKDWLALAREGLATLAGRGTPNDNSAKPKPKNRILKKVPKRTSYAASLTFASFAGNVQSAGTTLGLLDGTDVAF